jgi:hypothetical protein
MAVVTPVMQSDVGITLRIRNGAFSVAFGGGSTDTITNRLPRFG